MSVDEVDAAPPHRPTDAPQDEVHDQMQSRREFPVRLRRPRLGARSLTARFVTGVVALVTLLVVAIGAATYYELSSFLDQRFDQQLNQTATQNLGFFSRCVDQLTEPGQTVSCLSGPQTQREWVAAFRTAPPLTYQLRGSYANDLENLRLTAVQMRTIAANPNATYSMVVDGVPLRVTAGVNSGGLIVATGLSTVETEKTLDRLLGLELIIGLGAVALALITTYWGVRRSLRNLYSVTGTAREVATELSPAGAGLDRRVPVVEEGTEVGQLAESFNTMLAAVQTQFAARVESERRMRQFMADASHELRTPLTSIRGYAELARMQRAAGSDTQDNLDRIESEGTRMSRLVEDLMMLARGDADDVAGTMQQVPVDVAAVVDDAVSGTRAAFPGRVIGTSVSAVPDILGDRDQLLRVVRNLVTNAAVHTDPARPIEVRAFADAGGAVITVADGGPGLPPDEAAHVFERFWRADKARTRARGGSGLGMAIVATVVRAHGGTVRFDSSVERGSTVTVWLPAAHVELGPDELLVDG